MNTRNGFSNNLFPNSSHFSVGPGAHALTNKDVLDLVKMGMSSDVIVAKIKNSLSNFDTSLL